MFAFVPLFEPVEVITISVSSPEVSNGEFPGLQDKIRVVFNTVSFSVSFFSNLWKMLWLVYSLYFVLKTFCTPIIFTST